MSENSALPPLAYEAAVQQNFRRNYVAHCLDGGFFMGAMAFLAGETVMPVMIRSLGGKDWLLSMMPQMMALGFMLPPILLAHRMERMERLKKFIVLMGVLQRLPYVVAAMGLIFFADTHPLMVLVLVALTPFLSGIFGGISFGGWIEMTSRLIPAKRRSSSTAIRSLLGAMLGFAAGGTIKLILDRHPGAEGFGYLHLLAFGVLGFSLIAFSCFKEPAKQLPAEVGDRSLARSLREMPKIILDDARFRLYVGVRMATCGMFLLTPFLAIHAIHTAGRGEGFLGTLVQVQTAGAILGNLFAGWLGDKKGGRLPLLWSQMLYIGVCVGAVIGGQAIIFMAVFFFLGIANSFQMVGQSTLAVEICPEHRRPSYFAVMNIILFFVMLSAAGISTVVSMFSNGLFPGVTLAATLAACCLAAAHFLLVKIKDPRMERTA
ncbi:MAG: MFS transporter [Verrucomicrobiota bacterium]|nr:MFS transporter [Verrucomicrobiota bacterium]